MSIFEYKGKIPSLNQWYAGTHWAKRIQIKEKFNLIFLEWLTNEKIKPLEKYKIKMVFNSRLDPSNTITLIKIFEDFLTENKIIQGDSKQFCLGIEIQPDLRLKSDTYQIYLS